VEEDMGRLDEKVAVVTGGANGIGRACCERFVQEGARVLVADVLDDAGARTVAGLEELGGKAIFVHADATSPEDNEAVMGAAVTTLGGVDIVVTAAGISNAGYRSGDLDGQKRRLAARVGPNADLARQFADMPLEDWHRVIDVNLTGTFLALQSAARRMLVQGRGGSIITIASIAAKVPEAGSPSYGVSKAGVWMLTKHAARSLASAGIRVNAIGPGFIDTNMTAILDEMPEHRDSLIAAVPLGRMGTPLEVANAALFLASDESSYFTGELLHPDGGYYTD
jgi:NAD(P)-dependent dehydrogenase (short-subunit alcohol dehydrogenase family)